MEAKVIKTGLENIQPFRALFLQEANRQIRYNVCHTRGWTDSYFLTVDGMEVGYSSVKGKENMADRDAIFEFYVTPPFRKFATLLFSGLLTASGAVFIECQSNDRLLSHLLYEFAAQITTDIMLFEDDVVTEYLLPNLIFRPRHPNDFIFKHNKEPEGEYVLEQNGTVVATGGFALHYNPPFADLYMEVREDCRRKGLGTFLIQELKKECYLSGWVPAARCWIQNQASKATLLKAGMKIAGFMLTAVVKK